MPGPFLVGFFLCGCFFVFGGVLERAASEPKTALLVKRVALTLFGVWCIYTALYHWLWS